MPATRHLARVRRASPYIRQDQLTRSKQDLETAYEELQSTNEEMQTGNDDLRRRGDDLRDTNTLLETILTSVRSSVIVLDRELRVLAWNRRSEDLWGARAEEVRGQNFLNLDIGLPMDRLRAAIRSCLAGDAERAAFAVTATNRRGKPIECRVTGSPLTGANREARGVILMIDEEIPAPPPSSVH